MTPPLPADRKPHIEIVLVSSLKLSQKAWWHSKLWHQPHIENLDMNRGKRCMQRNRDKWCTQRSKFVLLQTQLSNYVMHVLYVLTLKAAVKHALMHCQQSADAAPLPIEAMYGLAALCLLRTQVDHTCREHMQRSHTENTCNTHAIHMQYTCNTHAIHMQYTHVVPAMLNLPGNTGTKARTAPQECPCRACRRSSPAAAAC